MLSEDRARKRREALSISIVVVTLTMIVWGIFALDRGLFQDDAATLAVVWGTRGFWRRLTTPIVSPTRVFAGAPAAIALLFPNPVIALQVLYGLLWAATGLLAYFIARRLFPSSSRVALFACALTLSATSDYLTDSLVAISYSLSTAFFLAALLALLISWTSRRLGWGVVFVLGVSASLWTADGALPGVLLAPVLLWASAGRRVSRRLAAHTIAWYAPVVPYLIVFTRFLRDPRSYAGTAVRWIPPGEWLRRAGRLFLYNFRPWRWAAERENWFRAPPSVLSPRWSALLALLGLSVFLWAWLGLRDDADSPPPESGEKKRAAAIAAVAFAAAFFSNAAFAPVQFSNIFYRTHISSRVWSSLALAVLAGIIFSKSSRPSFASLALLVTFVGLGLEGGLERQNYYLSYWKRHRIELGSILEAAPNLRPDSRVLLYVDSVPPYFRATAVDYLAGCWLQLLYETPMGHKTFVWARGNGSTCEPRTDRFVCYANDLQRSELDYADLVLFHYDSPQNRYELVPELVGLLAGGKSVQLDAYAPDRRIRFGRPSPLARSILAGPRYLASRLAPFALRPPVARPRAVPPLRLSLGPATGRIERVETLGTGVIRIAGWSSVEGKAPARVLILADDRAIAATSSFTGGARGAWEVRFPASALQPGSHRLEVLVVDAGNFAAERLAGEASIRISN